MAGSPRGKQAGRQGRAWCHGGLGKLLFDMTAFWSCESVHHQHQQSLIPSFPPCLFLILQLINLCGCQDI
jgi:hypothetical protein